MCDTCKRDQLSASIPFELSTIIYLLKRRSGHQQGLIWGGEGRIGLHNRGMSIRLMILEKVS